MAFNVDYSPVSLLSTLAQTSGEGQRLRQAQARDLSLIQLSMQGQAEARRSAAQSQATRLQAAALADRQRVARSKTPIARHIRAQVPDEKLAPKEPKAAQSFISNAGELSIIQQRFKGQREQLAAQLEMFPTENQRTAIQKQIDEKFAEESRAISEWRQKGRQMFEAPEPQGSASVTYEPPEKDWKTQMIEKIARGMSEPEAAAKIGQYTPTPTTVTVGQTPPTESVGPVRVSSIEVYNRLPSGTEYIGTDGRKRRKP